MVKCFIQNSLAYNFGEILTQRMIDLSHYVTSGVPVFPCYPPVQVLPWCARSIWGFESNVYFMTDHTGTHVDAPYHFDEKGKHTAEIALEKVVGEAVLLEVSAKGQKALIDLDQIQDAIKRARTEIRRHDKVLLYSGWDRHWDKPDVMSAYPGISKEAADYFVKLGVDLVGIDSPSIDHPDASKFPVHNTLLPKGIIIVENLSNLAKIRARRFDFSAIPLKLKEGTGSPVRAIAIVS